jgi:hypothetical protein
MERMRVTGRHVATRVVFLVSSLLLLVASCSLQKRVSHNAGGRGFVANEFCSACHYSFADESLARIHEIAGIGCERCHGESERHRSDEDNVTPPEIMYPRDKINPTCMMCHPRHEIRRVASHEMLLAGAKTALDSPSEAADPSAVCTDCHAKEHHIKVRTIRWNKATGERL